jgi:hypothetical protein
VGGEDRCVGGEKVSEETCKGVQDASVEKTRAGRGCKCGEKSCVTRACAWVEIR